MPANALKLMSGTAILFAMPNMALAQEVSGDQDEQSIVEIVVTAQKREQALNDVPLAVSAYSSELRENAGITSTQDLMNFTPGTSYSATGDRVSIRGIGRTTNQIGTDPGVAVYQDGFYVPGLAGVGGSTLGVDRIEVLRGPQGTLYGRNSVGGAINVVSKRPSSEFEGEFRASLSEFGGTALEGRISTPLASFVNASVMVSKVDQNRGYFRNVAGGIDEGGVVDSFATDVQLDFDLGSGFEAWVRWNYSDAHNHERTENLVSPYDTRYNIGLLPAPLFGADPLSNPGIANNRKFAANVPSTQDISGNHLIVGTLAWSGDGVALKYTGGFNRYESSQISDGDRSARTSPFGLPVDFQFDATHIGSPFNPANTPAAFDSDLNTPGIQQVTIPVSGQSIVGSFENKRAHSHELNLSSIGEGPFQWILGGYYYQETVDQGFNISLPVDAVMKTPFTSTFLPLIAPAFGMTAADYGFLTSALPADGAPNPNGDAFSYDAQLRTRSLAVYGQIDYDFSDEWHLTLGLRYSNDRKSGREAQRVVAWYPFGIATGQVIDTNGAFVPGGEITYNGPPIIINRAYDLSPAARTVRDDWNMVTGTAGIQWTPSDETLVYGSYSRGAKSGGFNLGAFSPAPVDIETVDAFEIGLKQSVARTLQVNLSGFYNSYDGMQVPDQIVPAPGVSLPVLVNVDKVKSYGLEIEAQWRASSRLTILANYSYLHSEIGRGCCYIDAANPFATLYGAATRAVRTDAGGNRLQSVTGNRTPLSPRHKVALNGTYVLPLPTSDLSISVTENIRSSSYYTIFNTPDYRIKGSQTTDLTIAWRARDKNHALLLNISNLFDADAMQSFTTTSPQSARLQTVGLQPPRVIKVEFQLGF